MLKHKRPIKSVKIENAALLYKRLLGYIRHYWFALLIAMIASLLYSGIDSWFVYSLEPLINKGLVEKNREFLHWAPIIVMLVFILRGLVSFFSNYSIAIVSRSVIMRFRLDIFNHIQRLPAQYYDNATSGQVISILLYSVEQIANASADVITTALQSFFLIVGLLIVMFSISWKLSLLYFIIAPIIVVIMRFTSKRIRRLSLTIQQSMAEITNRTEENVNGYKVVRTFGGQESEIAQFNKITDVNRLREMKVVATRSWSMAGVQLIAAFALSFTLCIVMLDTTHSMLSPGGFVTLIASMLALLKPIKDLTSMQNKLYRGLAGAQTVFELLDQPAEKDTGTLELKRAQGKIEFKDVSFCYQADKPVLRYIHFTVNPGEIVALVGRSGSGKSTLASLLPRFYSHFTGSILLDSIPTTDYSLAHLRRQFAIVSQHIILFNDTIANNIAYGTWNATSSDIREAAKAAYALDFIEQLPQGFDTQIGENGVLLSGGQRQRIAIARAILKNAPILILDEATSALDTESERYIQKALDALMRNRTTLVIAHRLSTVEHADRIIVLDQGQLVESGQHDELLMQQGHYAKLYQMQFEH